MLIALLAATAAAASTPAPAIPKPPPVDCRDAAHQGLGFWIGDWGVSDTRSGLALAESRIEPVMDGCGIRENFSQTVGPSGAPMDYRGTSYTALNALDGKWRQFYVDSGGGAVAYVGGLDGTAMVLNGANGAASNQMRLWPQADGSVRQTGAFSPDGGKTWQPAYDFTYRRR